MTQKEQDALQELRAASGYYEGLLLLKRSIQGWIKRWIEQQPPGWDNLVSWQKLRLTAICEEIRYIEQEYGNALLVSKQATLWIQSNGLT